MIAPAATSAQQRCAAAIFSARGPAPRPIAHERALCASPAPFAPGLWRLLAGRRAARPATDCGSDCSSTASSYELVYGSTRFLAMVKNPMEPSTSRWDGVVNEESHLAYLGEPETRRPRAASPRGVPSPGKSTHPPPPSRRHDRHGRARRPRRAQAPGAAPPPPARAQAHASSRERRRRARPSEVSAWYDCCGSVGIVFLSFLIDTKAIGADPVTSRADLTSCAGVHRRHALRTHRAYRHIRKSPHVLTKISDAAARAAQACVKTKTSAAHGVLLPSQCALPRSCWSRARRCMVVRTCASHAAGQSCNTVKEGLW